PRPGPSERRWARPRRRSPAKTNPRLGRSLAKTNRIPGRVPLAPNGPNVQFISLIGFEIYSESRGDRTGAPSAHRSRPEACRDTSRSAVESGVGEEGGLGGLRGGAAIEPASQLGQVERLQQL